MTIGILGAGNVARTIADRLLTLGHEVTMSSRSLDKGATSGGETLTAPSEWVAEHQRAGRPASAGSFQQAARSGEIVFNCTAGTGSLAAIQAAGADSFGEKILVDVANPLDFSQGMPPTLTVCNTSSLGEEIQAALPDAKVVKTLNTVSAPVMVHPELIPGDHDLFVAGNDQDAKDWVSGTLLGEWFGWRHVVDLGDITAARGMEMYLPLWLRLWQRIGAATFNVRVVERA